MSSENKYKKTILENHLTIVSECNPKMQSFALGICIASGSNKDPIDKDGLAHIIEHLAFKKTINKDSNQIANAFESRGAYFNAFTTKEYIIFYVRALTKHFDEILKLLWEVVFHADFNKENLKKEKKIIQEEILSYDNDYEDMIFDLADSILFQGNEYSHQIIGTKKTLQKIKLEDINNFHKQYFTSSNCIISYVGNQNHDSIVEDISKLSNKNSENIISSEYLRQINLNTPDIIEIHKPTQLYHLLIGAYLQDYNYQDRFALYLLNNILGDGMSSRLNRLLREKYSLAYNIYSSFQLYSKQGAFYIYTEVNEDNYLKAQELIYKEIENLAINGISQEELLKAKEQIKTSIVIELENMTERMEILVKDVLRNGSYETQMEFFNSIDNINERQIQEVVNKYLIKSNLKRVLIIPD